MTSEPLDEKSKVIFLDRVGRLGLRVKLKGVRPNTRYCIGLNLYDSDLPRFGGLERFAFEASRRCATGRTVERVGRYELGSVVSDPKGKAKLERVLPLAPGTYDVQFWIARGRRPRVAPVCYQSGRRFGDSQIVTVHDGVRCERTRFSFVVTGCGRSGTGFTSQLLTALGFPCGHEEIFGLQTPAEDTLEWFRPGSDVWGDSSCMAAPFLRSLPRSTLVLHQIRNPVRVVRSLMGFDFFRAEKYAPYVAFVLPYLPSIDGQDPPIVRCMKHWIDWNLLIEEAVRSSKLRYLRYRLEDLTRLETETLHEIVGLLNGPDRHPQYRPALESVSPTYNRRRRDPTVRLASLPSGQVKDTFVALALRYGYTREELEQA